MESAETERKDELPSDDYIMGFVEGEGCFSCSIEKYTDYRNRTTHPQRRQKRAFPFLVRPSFRITITKEDAEVLKKIKQKLGCGEIYARKLSGKHPNYADACQYYVESFADLYKIADFFRGQRFFTTKRADFEFWCRILEITKEGRHKTKEGFLEICRLRDQMNQIKGKVRKRTTRKIRAILENPPEHIVAYRKTQKNIHNAEEVGDLVGFNGVGSPS